MKRTTIGELVKSKRTNANLSIKELAKLTNLQESTIIKIEQDLLKPNPLIMQTLAEHLHTNPLSLYPNSHTPQTKTLEKYSKQKIHPLKEWSSRSIVIILLALALLTALTTLLTLATLLLNH